MFMFFHQIIKLFQMLCMVISVCLMMPIMQAQAQIPIYQLDQDKHEVVNYLYRLVDKSQKQSFNELINLNSNEWHTTDLTHSAFLIMPGENWFAFQLHNNDKETKEIYLEIANQVRMGSSKLYTQTNSQSLDHKKMKLQRSNHRSAMVTIAPYSQLTLYLMIESPTQLRSAAMIYSAEAYTKVTNTLQFKQGLAIGGLLCLSFVWLCLFSVTGNKLSLILFGYFLSNTLMLSAMLSSNLYYLLPHFPELIGVDVPLFTVTSVILLLVFTTQLFHLKNKFYKIYQGVQVVFFGLLLYIPLSTQLTVIDNISISMAICAVIILALIIIGIYLHKQTHRLALPFTFVMVVQFVFVMVFIISVNWYEFGPFFYTSLFYSVLFWLNAFLMTFIIGRQYYYQIKDKHEAQRQALTNVVISERAQEELILLQTQSQEELEDRVQERTLELNIALQELEEANHELEQKNILDELTGLFNRRFYNQKILAEYRRSKRNLTPLSIVLIDIDYFKLVNDTHGHLAGDQCLVWLSAQIKQNLKRSTDMAFRYGGEEFCLILPDTDSKGAFALAESLRKNIVKQTCTYKEIEIPFTISNGIYTYLQQDGATPEQLFAGADQALYQAKHSGRNQTQEFKSNLD